MDSGSAPDASVDAGAGGTGGTGTGGGTGSGGAGAGGAAGSDGGVDTRGSDLSNCPIRNCVERLAALQAGCSSFGVACVKEVHGKQDNYCFANGVRTYVDFNGTTGLATILKSDGHTCYTIYLTQTAGGDSTGAVKDPDGNDILLEVDSADQTTITFLCNGTQWRDDLTSCGAGGIQIFPFRFVDCPQINGQMCLRP
jgi:hypothetical protein